MSYESPVRSEIRTEIMAALRHADTAMTAAQLAEQCSSAPDVNEVARICYELRVKKGLVEFGPDYAEPSKRPVKTYCLATPESYAVFAERVAASEAVAKAQPHKKHPWTQAVVPPKQPQKPRVTRPLPLHLQSIKEPPAPVEPVVKDSFTPAADIDFDLIAALQETIFEEDPMTEETAAYEAPIPAFLLEPDAKEDIDSDLVDALQGLAAMVPLPMTEDDDAGIDDVLAMAATDVGEIAAAMVKKNREPLLADHANKGCQCLRINSLPPLPKGYIYGGIKVWIGSEHDVGRLTIATHDEGGGVFCSVKARGNLSFDPGDLVTIGQVADALIRLHEEMGHE